MGADSGWDLAGSGQQWRSVTASRGIVREERREVRVEAYYKAITALVVAVATALAAAIGNGSLDDLDTEGWIKVALVVLGGTAATWFAENVPGVAGGIIKAVLAAAGAGLTAWTVAYENDHVITQGEWLTVFIAVVGALTAVYQIRNEPSPT